MQLTLIIKIIATVRRFEAMQKPKTLSTVTQMLPQPVKEIDSLTLFGSARELLIRHSGELYRLRPTAKGGLILTK